MTGSIPTQKTRKIYVDSDNVKVVNFNSDEAEEILDVLSSETTRQIFLQLNNQPSTISEFSQNSDYSIQNAKYHIEKLKDSGIIKEIGEKYSKKGKKMAIYGPSNDGLIFVTSDENNMEKTLKKAIKHMTVPLLSISVLSFIGYYISKEYNQYNSYSINSPTRSETNDVNIETAQDMGNQTATIFDPVFKLIESNPNLAIIIMIISTGLISVIAYKISLKYL